MQIEVLMSCTNSRVRTYRFRLDGKQTIELSRMERQLCGAIESVASVRTTPTDKWAAACEVEVLATEPADWPAIHTAIVDRAVLSFGQPVASMRYFTLEEIDSPDRARALAAV